MIFSLICQKKSEILLPSEICKNTHFFTLHLADTKKTVGDGEKLLTYLNSALKALLGFDIFPRVPKKSDILLPSVIRVNYSVLKTEPSHHADYEEQYSVRTMKPSTETRTYLHFTVSARGGAVV